MLKPPVVLAAFALVAPAIAATPAQPDLIEFAGAPLQQAKWAGAEATVFGADGAPAYMGTQEFVLAAAKNPTGRVFAFDQKDMRVRITTARQPAVWLACADLQPMTLACATRFTLSAQGAVVISPTIDTRGAAPATAPKGAMPSCPGDLRCPRF